MATVVVLERLGDIFENKKLGIVFLKILPLMKEQEMWTPYKLLKEVTKDPTMKPFLKGHNTLKWYLDRLVKLNIVEEIKGDKAAYRLVTGALDQFEFIHQILEDARFKKEFDYQYTTLHILTCVIARSLRDMFPRESKEKMYSLTRNFTEIGVRLAIQDLIPRQVLEQQCNSCRFPYQDPEGAGSKAQEKKSAERSPMRAVNSHESRSPSLIDQIREFVWNLKEGMAKKTIITKFLGKGYSEIDINDAIMELINIGDFMQRDTGRYEKLGRELVT